MINCQYKPLNLPHDHTSKNFYLFLNIKIKIKNKITTITTKKLSCPSVFFPAFLQTAVIDKPIPALFVGALQSAAIGGL